MNHAADTLINAALFQQGHLKYQRLANRTYQIPIGSKTFRWNNIFNSGQLPSRVFMGIVSQRAYFGEIHTYPMFFESVDVSSVRFLVDGREILSEPYKPTFKYIEEGPYKRVDDVLSDVTGPYRGLMKTLGVYSDSTSNPSLTADEWMRGLCIYGVTLPSYGGMETPKGSFNVAIEFNGHLQMPHMCVVMGEFDRIIDVKGPERSIIVRDLE